MKKETHSEVDGIGDVVDDLTLFTVLVVILSAQDSSITVDKLELQDSLLDAEIHLTKREEAHKLVALTDNVEWLVGGLGEHRDLVSSQSADNASVFDDTLGTNKALGDTVHAVGDGGGWDGRDGDTQLSQGGNVLAALSAGCVRGDDVDDLEPDGALGTGSTTGFGSRAKQGADNTRTTVGEDSVSISYKVLAEACNLVSGFLCAFNKELSVLDEMVSDGVKITSLGASTGILKSGNDIALEEIGTGREGDWVRDSALQFGGQGGQMIESLRDSGRGNVMKSFDQGLNGGDGHGNVGVAGQDAVIGADDVEIIDGSRHWRHSE